MSAAFDLVTQSHLWDGIDAQAIAQQAWEACVARIETPAGAEATLLLCDDADIRRHNRNWRGLDKATNVLSFPTAEGPLRAHHLGDIVVAFETVAREAAESGKSFDDHFRHMIVHGFLHLMGYDHIVDQEAEAMEQMERDILAGLGVADPYRDERVAPVAAVADLAP